MLRGNKAPMVPFITKPYKLNNYAQMITEMKEIREKIPSNCYIKGCFSNITNILSLEERISKLGNIFTHPQKELTLDEIIQSVQEEKILDSYKKFENEINNLFSMNLKSAINNLKNYKESKIILEKSISTNEIKFIENNLGKILEANEFSDPLLGELYLFLLENVSDDYSREKAFLENQFIKHIDHFYKSNSEKLDTSVLTIEQKIMDYVKMRYNKSDFNIEVYEGRYLYAELYVLFRCGLREEMRSLIKSQPFFQSQFVEAVFSFLENKPKKRINTMLRQKDDLFKQTVYKMVTTLFFVDYNFVISTFEDALWSNFIISENQDPSEFKKLNFDIKQNRIKLMVAILTKEYSEVAKLIVTSDFSSVDVFFLGREILKRNDKERILFINFVFLIAKKASSSDLKLRLVNSINFLNYEEICMKLIEFEMLEVIPMLPDEYKYKVIEILRHSNNKGMLLKLHYLNNDTIELSDLLEDALTEEINSESVLQKITDFSFYNVFSFLKNKNCIEENSKLSILMNFLIFKTEKNLENLARTALFDDNLVDVIRNMDCTEKIIIMACEVVLKTKNHFYAKKIVEVANKLNISYFTQQNLLKRLVYVL